MSPVEQCEAIKLCFKLNKTTSESFELLQKIFKKDYLSRSKVLECFSHFKNGCELLEDDPCIFRLILNRTDRNIERVYTFYCSMVQRVQAYES